MLYSPAGVEVTTFARCSPILIQISTGANRSAERDSLEFDGNLLVYLFIYLFTQCLSIYLFLALFPASVGSVGIALTFFTGHFSTALVTWLGCRVAALIGGEICAISLLLSSFANDIILLLFSYSILFGFGCSCLFSAGMIVINQYFSKRQSIAAGVLSAGIGVGVLIMGPALEALTRATDWKTAFLVMAGVIFFVSLFAITFDPNVEEDQETTTCEEKEVEQDSGETKHGSIISEIKRALDVSIWKEPLVIALYLPEFFAAFGHFVPQIHLVRAAMEIACPFFKSKEIKLITESIE